MKARTLKLVFSHLLIIFLCWPLVHFYLVKEYDINPWKLFGFAMYATHHQSGVTIVDITQDNGRQVLPSSLPDKVQKQLYAYIDKRTFWGKFVVPDELGKSILISNENYKQIMIRVFTLRLEGKTGMIKSRAMDYHYEQ